MTTNEFLIKDLQGQLKRALKWMYDAAKYAQEGDFQMATYDMTVALQHWIKCQNLRDKYISDEDAEQIDWDSFTNKALDMAKQEIEQGE